MIQRLKRFFKDDDYFLRLFFGCMGFLSGIVLVVYLLLYGLGIIGVLK